MDTSVSVGRAAHRRLWEVVRAVAGQDVGEAGRLVQRFRDRGVFRLDPGAFTEFDNRQARTCLRDFLGPRVCEFDLGRQLVPEAACAELQVWASADLPLPLAERWAARPAWLATLEEQQLVRGGPRGLTLSPRLRIHLWLHGTPHGLFSLQASSPVREALRTLRRQGRWHEAARLAQAVTEALPEALQEHPTLPVTIALGYAQSQNYAWLSRWFNAMDAEGRFERVFRSPSWQARMVALRTFIDLERGEPARETAIRRGEARFWHTLVRCWGDLYAGRYRRALRTLDFMARRRSPRVAWLDPVLLAWRAAALYYLERYAESRDCNLRSLELASHIGWRERELVMLRNFAAAQFENGEADSAMAILKGLEHRHMIEGRLAVLPAVFSTQSLVMNLRVKLGTGAWTNRRAQHLGAQAEVMHQYLYMKEGQAVRARRSGLNRVSEQLFLEVETLATRIGHPLARGHALWNRSRMAWCRSDVNEALMLLAAAEAQFADMNQITRQADMKCDRALYFLELGQFDQAEEQVRLAELEYGHERRPREAALLGLLSLELIMRKTPEALTESDLDLIGHDREDTVTRTAYMYALVALGFALLEEDLTSRAFGKETLSQINRLLDPFITAHILQLGGVLRKRTRSVDELVSFWLETFPFQGYSA